MQKQGICHRMLSEMAFAIDSDRVVIRLKTAKNDIAEVTLLYGDRSSRTDPIPLISIKMDIVASDLYSDYFEASFVSAYSRICYCFLLKDTTGKSIYYYGYQFEEALPEARSEYFQIPYNHRADRISIPEWMQDAVVYNIFPDSFATNKEYITDIPIEIEYQGKSIKSLHGGTIEGVRENISYLKNLGINTVYLNPIFTAGEYHKYDTIDYLHIDPSFGTDEDFRLLVKELHENNIRIIIDGVFNHCGWHFPYFSDVVEKGRKSRYWNWFYHLSEPVIIPDNWDEYPSYECFGYERMMPKLALDNPEVEAYFCNVGRYWIEKYDVDGWRLDVADEIHDSFWRKFRHEVKKAKPDCALIGEVWCNSKHWLDGSMFDSTMNYDIWRHSKKFFAEKKITAEEFDARVTDMLMRYASPFIYAQMNLLDSHDVSRFYSLCSEDYKSYRLAIVFLFTFVGMPMVFYGDEYGMAGIKEADFRAPMAWGREDSTIFRLFKKLIALRNDCKALRSGSFRTVCADAKGMYTYSRTYEDEIITIVLNRNDHTTEYPCDKIIYQEGYCDGILDAYGFIIYRN